MKKFSFAKIASLVFVCAMLLCAFAVTTLAADDPAVEIVSNNAYYGEKYQLIFAVNAPEGANVSATDSEGNALGVAIYADDPNPTIRGIECTAYIIKEGVAVQALDEVITFTVEYNGKVATKSYSFLQYVYERMYVSNIAVGAEREMFEALLAFADVADVFFDGTDADKTISNYKYVTVVDGTLDGDNKAGMFLPGATPFANIEATLDYDNTQYNVEWDVSVDGADAVRYDNDAIKTLEVTGNTVITRALVESECTHEWGDATCTTPATCTKCGETTGELAEHTWVDATCEHKKYCSVCEIEEGELAEHTWSDWSVSDATCTENGSKSRECGVCGETETETILATGVHTWGDWNVTVDATCTENGSKSRECGVCGETETETIDATGIHTWGDWNVTADATCSKAGEQTRTCTVCETATETETIPATGAHADATSDGKCDGCGGVIVISYTLVTDVNNLQAGDKIIIVAKSGTIVMTTEQKSNNRGQATYTKNGDAIVLPANAQIITLENGTVNGTFALNVGGGYLYAPTGGNYLRTQTTLTANGCWTITISNGTATVKSQAASKNWLRHNSSSSLFSCYDSGQADIAIYEQTITVTCAHDSLVDVERVEPTCTEKGSESGICVVCDEPVVKEIPAKGHTEEAVPAVDATCGKDGLTAGVVCTVCKTTLVEQEVVYATGEHADGDSDGFCDVCKLDMNKDEAKAEQVLAGITGPADVTKAGDITLDIINDTAYEATITWAITGGTNTASSVNGNTLTVVLADKESTLQLTVTVTVGEATATEEYTIKVSAGQVVYTLQATTSGGVTYYWDGTSTSSKGGLTTDASKAGKVYIEESSGTYYAYILDGSTKKYLKIGTNNTSFTLTNTKTAISYDSATGYLYANNRYLATYGTQDMRTYLTSNIKDNNLYMVLTPIG